MAFTVSKTPKPPYYAAIFTSVRTPSNPEGCVKMAKAMGEFAATRPGFLGLESAREYSAAENLGVTVSYWESLEAIAARKQNAYHKVAQKRGQAEWYANFQTRISKVERDYGP
jgi:heme-degrading monooxygenase HmoA